MPPVWGKLSLSTDGPLRASSSSLSTVTRSPVMVPDYLKGLFTHHTGSPAGDPRYETSFDRLVTVHVQKPAVTTDQTLAVGFTLAALNREIKELAALSMGALIEVGFTAFLGLCSGAWLPEMFVSPPVGTAIVGVASSLDDDGQSNASYKEFASILLGHEFKMSRVQSDRLYELLIADDLPERKHDGTALNGGERSSVSLADLVPPLGTEVALDGKAKSLKLGDSSSTSISQLKEAWRDFMGKVTQKAVEIGHMCIIAASYRLSGARLGNLWGIDDQATMPRGARMTVNRREQRSTYSDKHLRHIENGALLTSLFQLPQKGNLTNCVRMEVK